MTKYIAVWLILLISTIWCDNLNVETIKDIASGGTNSGTALNNGRIAYSSSGSIIEASYIKSNGDSLTIGDSGASSVVPTSSVKVNLVGASGSVSNGPTIHTYTSSDNYTVLEILPYNHNDVSINFDSYYNSGWKSSYSGSNFQIFKHNNTLDFTYASGGSQGSSVTSSSAMAIGTNGKTTFGGAIKLPSAGATASDFNHYSEITISAHVDARNAGDVYIGYSVTHTTVRFTRTGNTVSVAITPFLGTLNSGAYITIFLTGVPSAFLPSTTTDSTWPITIGIGGCQLGILRYIYYRRYEAVCDCIDDIPEFRIYTSNGGLFPTGSNEGLCNVDIPINYIVY